MPHSSKSGRTWLIPLFVLLLIGMLLCVGPVVWWAWRRSNAFETLQQRRAALVDRGQPIDDASLEAYRESLMGKEKSQRWMAVLERIGSETYQQAAADVPVVGMVESEQPFIPGKPYPHDRQTRDFLEQWTDLRDAIHAVTEGSESIWTDIELDSFNTLLPYVQASRSAARLISLEFDDAIRRDAPDEAYGSLRSLIGIARSVEDEPLIISQLVHIALTQIALDKVKVAVEREWLSSEQLKTLLEELRAFDDFGRNYQLAISGERAMSQPVFDDLGRFGEQGVEIPKGFNQRPIDAIVSLDVLARAESIENDNLTAFLTNVVAVEQDFNEQMEQAGWLYQFDTMLTGLLTPAIGAFGRAVVRHAMSVRLAKLGIAARLFSQQHQRLPSDVNELTNTYDLGPVEPVGDRPFGYQRRDQMAELWGFDPQTPSDRTPTAPEAATDETGYEAFWLWTITADRTAEKGID